MKKILLSICCIFLLQIINAQDLPKSWGNFVISTEVDYNGVALQFDWLRENMNVKISDDGSTFTIGGDDISIAYKTDMNDGTFKLQTVVLGQEYINKKIEKEQREKGVPIKGKNTDAIKNLVYDLVDLVSTTYKVNKNYGAGFKDASYENGIGIELYGKGNAYVGEFKNAIREGKGNYIIGGQQMLSGTFKNGIQEGMFQLQDASGTTAKGLYVNGKREGTWTYTYADGSTQEAYYKNGEEAVQLISQLPKKESLDALIIEEIKNGQVHKATKPYAFWLSTPGNGYRFDIKNTGLGWEGILAELIDIKEEAGKRVETYKHNFKKREGSSNPTLTFFDKRQSKNNIEYNIVLHLITEKFDKKIYCLFDEASVKVEEEAKRKREEAKNKKEMAMYNNMAAQAKKIIADAPNQFENVIKESSINAYKFFSPTEELPYFKNPGSVHTSTRLNGINIQYVKSTFAFFLGYDVPKLVAALDKVLSPEYTKCLNKECDSDSIPNDSFYSSSHMKDDNLLYMWKQKNETDQSTGQHGTVILFYDAKDQRIILRFHALYKEK